MKLMPHYATGSPGDASQLFKRKSKSFIFFDVLLHGQEILTIFFPIQELVSPSSDNGRLRSVLRGGFTEFLGKVRTFQQLILYR